MIFSKDFIIGLDDVNSNLLLRDKSILRFMENIACYHTDSVGRGINDIENIGKAWALLEWEVKIIERPHYGDLVRIDTWGRKISRSYVYRDFAIYVGDKLCVKASSKWFYLDIYKRRPVRITEEDMAPYESEDKSILEIDEIEKLYEKESYTDMYDYTVRRCDMDALGHLHNTNYLDIVYDAFTDEEVDAFSHIRISYKKEVSLGEKLFIKRQDEENKVCFIINNGEVTNAIMELSK